LGVAYKWFALELAEGVYQSGYRPLNSRQFEQTDRFQIEVAAEVQISLGETGKLFIGPAARLRLDWVETQSIAASGELVKETRGEARVRPAVFFGFASGLFFVRGSYWDDPRMDFGLVWGR